MSIPIYILCTTKVNFISYIYSYHTSQRHVSRSLQYRSLLLFVSKLNNGTLKSKQNPLYYCTRHAQ